MRFTPLLLVPLAMLAACTTPVDTGFGEAFKWDMAQQVINPDPVYEGEAEPGGDGKRVAAAQDRYRKGNVKQPASIQTTTSGSGPQ